MPKKYPKRYAKDSKTVFPQLETSEIFLSIYKNGHTGITLMKYLTELETGPVEA